MKRTSMRSVVTVAMWWAAACGQTVAGTAANFLPGGAGDRAEVRRLLGSIEGNTIVVAWDGTWDYPTIQEALDASGDGDTIIVLPSEGSPGGAYLANIYFPAKQITLRSVDPDDPTIVSRTIIDGNAAGSVVAFAINTTADAVLDGFTIRNGETDYGGGVYCYSSSPTIRRCTIIGNTAGRHGGGIFCYRGQPTFDRCRILGNLADYGGGLANTSGGMPMLTSCTFSGNEATGCG